MKTQLLWLVWQNVNTRRKYHVGNLLYNPAEGYSFNYVNDKKHRGLEEALKNGFIRFLAFPDLERLYHSPFLFHAFSRRLPNKNRPDYDRLLSSYGLDKSAHEMELLRVTKGKTATDGFELVSPVFTDNDSNYNVEFYIEGWRYYDGENALASLSPNQILKLEREPDNVHDRNAVKILSKNNKLLGYVPAVYSEFFSELLRKEQKINIHIDDINENAIPQMKLFVRVSGKLPKEFRLSSSSLLFPLENKSELVTI